MWNKSEYLGYRYPALNSVLMPKESGFRPDLLVMRSADDGLLASVLDANIVKSRTL
jgi:hypothetical protein